MVRPIDISNVLNSLQFLGQSNQRYADLERRNVAKRSGTGAQLGGLAGGIIGGYYGGPAGAAAGAAGGSMIGAELAGGGADEGQVARSSAQGYQMGSTFSQQRQNKKFNNFYAETIEQDPNATPKQKQFAGYIKGSYQDPNITQRQAQYLGVDPKTLQQEHASRANNSAIVERGLDAIQQQQEKNKYEPGSPEFNELQGRMDRLKELKNSPNFGKLREDSIRTQVRKEVPLRTEIYNDEKTGKVLSRTVDPLTNQSTIKSLGNIPSEKQNLYQVPYYDRNGNPKVTTFTDREKALNFANEQGTGILDNDKSIFLEGIKAGARSGKKDVEYRVTTDVIKRRDAISKRLTRKNEIGETILPQEQQVDEALRNELRTMARTTTGREKNVIQRQYQALDQKVKDETTQAFVSALPQLSPDLETTNKNIEQIKKSGPPQDVDRERALAALESLKSRYEQQVIARQQQQLERRSQTPSDAVLPEESITYSQPQPYDPNRFVPLY